MCETTKTEGSHGSVELDTLAQQVAALRDEIHEVREMVASALLQQHLTWIDLPPRPTLFSGHEGRITLEEAVPVFWGKSAGKDAESRSIHADFLRRWATIGLNGVLLETETVEGKWYTSRKAVQRFQEKINMKRR